MRSMSFFNNLRMMKNSIAKTANNISSNIATNTMEQSNLNRIYRELDTIDMEIEAACT